MKNTWLRGAAACTVALSLALVTGCGTSRNADGTSDSQTVYVGISMPEQMLERWKNDGENLKRILEGYGYDVTLQYADGKTDLQTSQIQNMANNGMDYVVIASIDGTSTGAAAEQVRDNGGKVFAYDRLIMNTDAVDYYATFSLEDVGRMQGEYIESRLGLKDGAKGPFNVELMAGSPTDNNAGYYFKGAWGVLGKYYESGVLRAESGKVPSSAADWQSIGIDNWDRQKAQNEMENRVNSFYNHGAHLDAVLAQNDAEATGAYNAVEGAGWDYYPVITGQDAEKVNVRAIVDGKQAMTVYKDTNELAQATASMIKDMVEGKAPEAPDTFNNGTKDVPSRLLTPVTVDKDNVREVLVDTGYISAEDAGLD